MFGSPNSPKRAEGIEALSFLNAVTECFTVIPCLSVSVGLPICVVFRIPFCVGCAAVGALRGRDD